MVPVAVPVVRNSRRVDRRHVDRACRPPCRTRGPGPPPPDRVSSTGKFMLAAPGRKVPWVVDRARPWQAHCDIRSLVQVRPMRQTSSRPAERARRSVHPMHVPVSGGGSRWVAGSGKSQNGTEGDVLPRRHVAVGAHDALAAPLLAQRIAVVGVVVLGDGVVAALLRHRRSRGHRCHGPVGVMHTAPNGVRIGGSTMRFCRMLDAWSRRGTDRARR